MQACKRVMLKISAFVGEPHQSTEGCLSEQRQWSLEPSLWSPQALWSLKYWINNWLKTPDLIVLCFCIRMYPNFWDAVAAQRMNKKNVGRNESSVQFGMYCSTILHALTKCMHACKKNKIIIWHHCNYHSTFWLQCCILSSPVLQYELTGWGAATTLFFFSFQWGSELWHCMLAQRQGDCVIIKNHRQKLGKSALKL